MVCIKITVAIFYWINYAKGHQWKKCKPLIPFRRGAWGVLWESGRIKREVSRFDGRHRTCRIYRLHSPTVTRRRIRRRKKNKTPPDWQKCTSLGADHRKNRTSERMQEESSALWPEQYPASTLDFSNSKLRKCLIYLPSHFSSVHLVPAYTSVVLIIKTFVHDRSHSN